MTDEERGTRVLELLDELMELSDRPPLSQTLREAMSVVGGELDKMRGKGEVDDRFVKEFQANMETQFTKTLTQTFALASDQLKEQLGTPEKTAELLKKSWEQTKNGNTEL